MGPLCTRVESWIKEQTARVGISWPRHTPQQWRWPPWKGQSDRKNQEKALREPLKRHLRQLNDLCRAVKAESIADLQEILCSMVLFEYLLAEAGDTISFVGTKHTNVIADANILQGAIFHEDNAVDDLSDIESGQPGKEKKIDENLGKPIQANRKRLRETPKPAAHRGFLARAKGIPALELYKLAQKKNRKLVFCGHSLGGAVAVLSTLAILIVLATSSLAKEHENVPVTCITFSQPPVGNAALRDYVHQKGWQGFFKTYCIPEDLVPRILSPAYFHHYNTQVQQPSLHEGSDGSTYEEKTSRSSFQKGKTNDGEELVLGIGPVQTSIWRLTNIVPLEDVCKHLNVLKKVGNKSGSVSSLENYSSQSAFTTTDSEPNLGGF